MIFKIVGLIEDLFLMPGLNVPNLEKYLINVSKFYYSKIIKYRTGNHRLPVETVRWDNKPLNERKCKICTTVNIGDEYHYLFTCDFLRATENLI